MEAQDDRQEVLRQHGGKPVRLRATRARSKEPSNRLPQPSLTLREPDILDSLTGAEREVFLSKCVAQHYSKGEYLCVQGNVHCENFLVREGLVRTYYTSPVGREITLGYWSKGNLAGGPSFFDSCNHIWSVQAVRNSRVLSIKTSDFRALTLQVPAIADCVINALSFKLNWFSIVFQTLGTESAATRVARVLLLLSNVHGTKRLDGTVLRLNFTHEDIGNMVSATRPWVSMVLSKLQKDRIIKISRTHEMKIDVQRLEQFLADAK